ncbi:MAG: carboxymethylenebutenolidase [Alphaproteobacteria bacterium]|nr:carboxymethylenebutenolidase [Alphaproteobacteria bacterium]
MTQHTSNRFRLSRRGFGAGALGLGFTLAAGPVAASAIVTSGEGLIEGEVAVPTSDGAFPAYRAKPAGEGPFPVILVTQEIFGVHAHIQDLCRRLAKQGYLAIAPDLYVRQGDVSAMTEISQIVDTVVAKVPDAQVMADLDATVAWAEGDGGDTSRLGITGFCWGGRIVWLYAAHSEALKAGVAWYGRLVLVGPASDLRPKQPVDLAGELKAPVLGLYGGQDQGIPLETVEAMRAALKAADDPSQIIVYPDAPHGFNADYRPSYREADAQDGWTRMLEWFKSHGVA